MAQGRKITLHLVEGTPSSIMKGQLGNWVGLVTYAPRIKLNDLAKDLSVYRAGAYVLIGPDPDNASFSKIYVGQSESVMDRLKQHDKDSDKDFFEHLAVITRFC